MAFDSHVLDEIRSRLKISDVIGSHMQLVKKGGGEWVAKGNESFTVSDKKGIWTEFGSDGDGKGHDVFDFLQVYAGLDFPAAVKELAHLAGVDLAQAKSNGSGRSSASVNRPGDARRSGDDAAAGRSQREEPPRDDRSDRGVGDASTHAAPEHRDAAARGKKEITATWDYLDPENRLLYQVVRMQERMPDGEWRRNPQGKIWKTFMQRRPDGDGGWILGLDVIEREEPRTPLQFVKTPNSTAWLRANEDRLKWKNITVRTFEELGNVDHWLYNANEIGDELQEPKEDQRPIFIPEGEAKVDVLREWGLLAVTNSGGAKHFTKDCAEFFRGARQIVLLQDNDRAGAERVAKLGPMLKAVDVEHVYALNFRDVWPKCPPKGDVKDWRDDAGGTKEDLLDIVDRLPEWKPEPYKSKFGAKTSFDLGAPVRPYPWRIKGILPMYDNTLLMGPSRSGKTFECLDMLMHLHSGEPFAGRKVVPCGSVYLTYEGATGFENRLRAYLHHYGISAADLHSFAWITRPPNLFASEDNAKSLAEEVVRIAEGFQLPLGAIVVDTHNAASRGSSEIKSEDINRILENYQTLRDLTGSPLIIVGHTNAEGKHRGNEQFFNNIETAILVERVYSDIKTKTEKRDDNGRVVRRGVMQKQREGDDRIRWEFVLEPVEIGKDEDGDPITSMVSIEPAQHVPGDVLDEHDKSKPRPEGFSLRGHDVGIFKALLKVIDHLGAPPPAHLGIASSVHKVVKWADLVSEYRKSVPQEDGEDVGKYRNRIKARTRRFAEGLLTYNVIGILQEPGTDVHYVWPTGRRVYGKGLQWPPAAPKKKEQAPILASGESSTDPMPF